MKNALSIDLEDWYHPLLVQPHLKGGDQESRVVEATYPLLALLRRHQVRATFFCVGEILQRHPELVRQIHAQGHEVAFHGMTHKPLWNLTAEAFEAEVEEFEELVTRVLGKGLAVRGFRAPTFSLDSRTAWALPILVKHGYSYDSSVFPMKGPLYGIPGAPTTPYRVSVDDPGEIETDSPLLEFPPAVCEVSLIRIPVGGGVYLRFLPLAMISRLLGRINRDRPFVLYVHPWETDPETPRMPLNPLARFATYHGLATTLTKLDRLLTRFRFTTMGEVVDHWVSSSPATAREARC